MKRLKIIGIIVGVLLLILTIVGVIFSTIYEDKVKNYILTELNNNVTTKIDVAEINFSVFKKFPYASLEFKKITAEEVTSNKKKGKLFSAQSIFLQFNIFDILNDDYTIKKIQVEEGDVNININKFGHDNYHFWKESETTDESPLSLALEKLTFKNITFYVLNEYKNLDMAIDATDVTLSGNFSDKEFTLTTAAELYIQQINSENINILKDKVVRLNTSLHVNQTTKQYHIKKGEFKIQDLSFNLSGNIKNQEVGVLLDIVSEGENLEIEELFSLFPEKQKEALNAYKTQGNITYATSIKGEFSIKKSPAFNTEFTIKDGKVTEKSSNQSFTNLNLIGRFSNGKAHTSNTSQLTIDQLDADFGAGHISGKYIISNFINPYINFDANATIDLETAKEFLKIDTLEIATGEILLNLKYKGYIKELSNIKAKDLQRLTANGTAQINNVNLKVVNSPRSVNGINGFFKFDNNTIQVDSLNAKINQTDISIKGKITNLLAYLFLKDESLNIYTQLNASKIVLDDLLLNTEDAVEDSNYTIHLPKNIDFNFKAQIDTFQFRKFRATQLSGNIKLKDEILNATQLVFNALDGKVTGNLSIDNSKNEELLITSKTHLNNIDMYQLFFQFENFGQDYIVDENLKGRATTNIEFASVWDKEFTLDQDKMYVLADIDIKNGELIDYKPILAMSKFIEVEELERIKFDQLTTHITINNKTIHIPKTEILSSALDLTISGTHTFDNQIDYRFKLLLNDVLWGKAKNNKKENNEFGYIEDDGLGRTTLFLHMKGTVDDYKLSYDTKGLKESWSEDLKEEKKNLKTILKDEFGWFKKDSTLTNEETKKDDGFILEWEEEETNETQKDKKLNSKKKKKEKKPKKKKKGLGKFIDKVAQPDEEEFEESDDF